MNWKVKVLMHSVLPHLPYGDNLHYWMQKNITKRIPRSVPRFDRAVEHAEKHLGACKRYSKIGLSDTVFFEFGAGWDLPIQLLFYAAGVNRQVIIDLNNLARKELINDAITRILQRKPLFAKRLPEKLINGNLEHDLRNFYGIEYIAPCDARATGLSANSIDFITSTETLQLIPVEDLKRIMVECYRILKPGAFMSVTVDYDDHYAFFDSGISVYNFLKYSDSEWVEYNPSNHYQNRLRHTDYVKLFEAVGFRIIENHITPGNDSDLEAIRSLTLNDQFRNYAVEDLSIHDAYFVIQKPTEIF